MSTNLEQVAASLEARFTHNLTVFKIHEPALYSVINQTIPKHSRINITEKHLELYHHEQSVYSEDPISFAQKQVEAFLAKPDGYAIRINKPRDDTPQLQDQHLLKICNLTNDSGNGVVPYRFDGENIPLLFVTGLGLAYQIELLVKKTNIRNLIIYEPDIEIFILSLYCINWEDVFVHFTSNHNNITFIFGDNVDKAVEEATSTLIQQENPTFSLFSLYLKHYDCPSIANFTQKIKPKLLSIVFGIGYYDDEMRGLRHTLANIKHKVPVLTNLNKVSNDAAVFLCVSGPSISSAYDSLKEHKQNAVIISCGSGLSSLLANNIIPDFHIEMERTETLDALSMLNADNILQQIHFIGLNVVEHKVFDLFKSQQMALKSSDAGASLFEKIQDMEFCLPTVINLGLSLSLYLGFKNIYLFGNDLGSKDIKQTHSDDSLYYLDNPLARQWNSIWGKDVLENKLPGNFGGEFYSRRFYLRARESMINLMQLFPQAKVYNCSDGIQIPGTIPTRANEINVLETCPKKADTIKAIKSSFSTQYLKSRKHKHILQHAKKQIPELLDNIINILEKPIHSQQQMFDCFDEIYDYFFCATTKKTPGLLLNGTLINSMIYIYSFSLRPENSQYFEPYIKQANKIFIELLLAIKKDSNNFFQSNTA